MDRISLPQTVGSLKFHVEVNGVLRSDHPWQWGVLGAATKLTSATLRDQGDNKVSSRGQLELIRCDHWAACGADLLNKSHATERVNAGSGSDG